MIHITRLPVNNYIRDMESFFNIHLDSKSFDEDDLQVIKGVDNAELLDSSTGLIRTPYGLTSIRHLSTGCKTILVYNYCRKNNINKVINVTESGANALEILFNLMGKYKDSKTLLYLGHDNKLEFIKEHDFNVDGKVGRVLCLM